MKKYNSTELIKKANDYFDNLDKIYGFDKSSFFEGYVSCYASLVHDSKDMQNDNNCVCPECNECNCKNQ